MEYVLRILHIPYATINNYLKMEDSKITKEFSDWLQKFAKENNIIFPQITKFFRIILCCLLKSETINGADDLNHVDIKEYIKKARDKMCKILENYKEDTKLQGDDIKTLSTSMKKISTKASKLKDECNPMQDI